MAEGRLGPAVVALLLLAVLAAPSEAAVQSAPVAGVLNYSYTPSIVPRSWLPGAATCTAWNNSSGPVCVSWLNTSVWDCGSTPTYLFTPSTLAHNTLEKDSSGFTSNVSITGMWTLADAGVKALAGASAFNENFCLNRTNATVADISDMQAELSAIGLAAQRGQGMKYVPVPADQAFSMSSNLERESSKRVGKWKAGNHSVTLEYTSSADFNNGLLWNVSTANPTNSVTLSTQSGSDIFSYAYADGTGITVSGSCSQAPCSVTFSGGINWSRIITSDSIRATSADSIAASTDYVADFKFNPRDDIEGAGTSRTAGLFGFIQNDAVPSDAANRWEGMALNISSVGGGAPGIWRVFAGRYDGGGYTGDGGAGIAVVENTIYYARISRTGTTLQVGISTTAANLNNWNFDVGSATLALGSAQSYSRYAHYAVPGVTVGGSNAFTTGWTDDLNVSSSTYVRNGSWLSPVMNAGTVFQPWYRWLNFTNDSTVNPASAGMSWEMRTGNTSWNIGESSSPAWTPLGNQSNGANVLTNISRYLQMRASLWSNSNTVTPQMDSFIAYQTALPNNTAALTANVTYAAPGQPVLVGVLYVDAEDGEARLSLFNNSSSTARFCTNATRATGNSTAQCAFLWNRTDDNVAPSTCIELTDNDGAANTTNCSAPVITDSAVPVIDNFPAIANTSTGSFVFAVNRTDSASSVNRTWFSIYNLSNNSAGDTPMSGNWTNTTFWSNDTIALCSNCYGQVRVAVTADDSVGTSPTDGFRHWSGYSNNSFWFDPAPDVTGANLSGGASPSSVVTVRAVIFERVSNIHSAWARVRSPSSGYAERQMWPEGSGENPTEGVWRAEFQFTDNFTDSYGTYQVQVAARDTSTSDYGTAANLTVTYGAEGSGSGVPTTGTAGGGGGPAPISQFESPPPAAAAAAVPTQGLACPPEVRQVHYITPYDRGTSRWGLTCRTLSGFAATGCSIVGEKVATNGTLTGEADPWWSCQAVGEDRVQITYTIPQAQISDEMFLRFIPTKQLAWNTLARVRAESGQNVTALDVRLRVSNFWAAPLRVPVPFPLSSVVSALAPMAPATLLLAAAMAFGAWYRKMGNLAWFWYVGAGILAVFGFGSVVGGVLQGILLGWVLYSGVAVAVWGLARLDAVQKARELKAHLAKG